jgi:hypothetical protein
MFSPPRSFSSFSAPAEGRPCFLALFFVVMLTSHVN